MLFLNFPASTSLKVDLGKVSETHLREMRMLFPSLSMSYWLSLAVKAKVLEAFPVFIYSTGILPIS